MGSTVSSYSTARRLEVGSPGGRGQGGAAPESAEALLRRALADRIEDSLSVLLERAEGILRDDRAAVLAIAHALETHKTLTGDDIEAVLDGREGISVDGRVYRNPEFVAKLEECHSAAAGAHAPRAQCRDAVPAPGRAARGPGDEGRGHPALTARRKWDTTVVRSRYDDHGVPFRT